ncbi:hypothetical protein H4R34_002833 [Dimargaris verticillata]|uniref:3-beta hydroxysteroid dehydrogenase/isomerase domain-containing protein n=1 Tax=Dimargaris verticillata TaxID=2761393 RepID=A0A9W8B395_9FUNG|nr:hypothetical protein H4R34_002833 [Dimargaris verticillata]
MTKDIYLVIGGCGFLGSHIVEQLVEKYPDAQVRILDLRRSFEAPKATYFIGDICDYDLMAKACTGATAVIHTASPHMGTRRDIMYRVNVEGTQTVIKACQACQVPTLVFTSSSSVVMGAQGHIRNADETWPYPEHFFDYYGETKAKAEQLVLQANDPKGLRTCSLRPVGIFGPRDQQMVPKAMGALKKKANLFQLGSNRILIDCTYVTNVAHAHLLAVEKLPTFEAIAGEAFFITNDNPILFWDQMRALWSLVGASTQPLVIIPDWLALIIYYIMLVITSALTTIHPSLTSNAASVLKLLLTHRYFNITKAKTYLGYRPIVPLEDGFRRSAEWYQSTQKNS